MAYASEVEHPRMGSVRSMRKQESHEFIRGSVKQGSVGVFAIDSEVEPIFALGANDSDATQRAL